MHTAAWHAWTRTPPLNFVLKAVFSRIHFPAPFIRLWPSCHSDLGGSRHGWELFLEQTEFLQNQLELKSFTAAPQVAWQLLHKCSSLKLLNINSRSFWNFTPERTHRLNVIRTQQNYAFCVYSGSCVLRLWSKLASSNFLPCLKRLYGYCLRMQHVQSFSEKYRVFSFNCELGFEQFPHTCA